MSKTILIQRVCTENGTKKDEESTSNMRTKTHSARCFCSLRPWMSVGIFPLFHPHVADIEWYQKV